MPPNLTDGIRHMSAQLFLGSVVLKKSVVYSIPLFKRNFGITHQQQDCTWSLHGHSMVTQPALAERSHLTTRFLKAILLQLLREALGTK